MPDKGKTETKQEDMSTESLPPMLDVIIGLLGRLVFPEEKLRQIVTSRKRNPEQYVKAYNLCDGEHGVTEIANEIGVKQQTLSPIFTGWEELGIIHEVNGKGGKFYKKVYALGAHKASEVSTEEGSEVKPAETTETSSVSPPTQS